MKKKDAILRAACVVLIVLSGAGCLISCKGSRSKTDSSTKDTSQQDPQDTTQVSASEADEDDILANCPFELSDGLDWNYYPPENVPGFTALGREDLDGMRTDIFVFDLRATEYGSIITEAESIETCAKRGMFEADEKETSAGGDYYFVKLKYDSRIELYWLAFRVGFESIYVEYQDGLDVLYSDFVSQTFITKYQNFDEALGSWSEVTETEEELPDDTGASIEPIVYDELEVLAGAYEPSVVTGDMTLSVNGYRWEIERYNIYDEIETPSHMILYCTLYAGYEKTFEEYGDEIPDLDPSQMKLFVSSGNDYTEITPDDFTVNVYLENEAIKYFEVCSESIGELQEGDYRLEIDGCTVDFRLEIQTFEVW
ncbi:MAG: hypothetical protein J6U54_21535 [Clostridiales bacterium]|nr:hypothetical protein [Clostridiales bacterium]